ncbi:MAG: immunoglobulin domain-containing protein [Pseudomonadales bacterium]|nr:immunoglobulin domain-containing protein [Pseudomonadales bacterium]
MKLVNTKLFLTAFFCGILVGCGGAGSSGSSSSDSSSSVNAGPIDSGSDDSDSGDDVEQPASLSITSQPSSQTLSSSSSLELSLQVSSTDAIAVTWYKDDIIISQSDAHQFSALSVTDTGTYSCRVEAGELVRTCSSFTLTVLDAPSVTRAPSNQVVTEGEQLTMSVEAQGSSVVYQWYFDGEAIAGANSDSLVVSNTELSDQGSYYCVVSNAVGNAQSSSASVSVLEATTYGNATVTWDRPTTRSDGSQLLAEDIQSYKVYFGPSADAGYANSADVDGGDLSVTLEDLESGEYKVAISTIDSAGRESARSSDYLVAIQ